MDDIQKDILKGWRVLVVDDEDDSLDVASRILAHYQAEVMIASGGNSAYAIARQQQPDFIVSDLSMPDGDGWSLLQQLRGDDATATIPVIALTAHAMLGDQSRVLEAGFNGYLSKPLIPRYFIKHLIERLRQIPEFASRLGGNDD